ncbi:Arc family DNA-binding protein [Comamonas sp. B21-038]|uniref:Arc family DNA-binding protein n=1 Tax=Comamonas sp. B21-038 TaxID=2918299 RepID=UPI00406C6349
MLKNADTGQFKVRLPLELKQWLQGQAEAQRRSLTAEVIIRLESTRPQAPDAQKGTPP